MKAFIGVGSNISDRQHYIDEALKLIGEISETKVLQKSSFKEYVPEPPCGGDDLFLNGTIEIETSLLPLDLLHKLQVIERKLGRQKKGDGSPRVIDLDILFYGEEVSFVGKNLTIPHPRIQERIFVLEPLAEIAPDWIHPASKKSIRVLLGELSPSHANHQVSTEAAKNA